MKADGLANVLVLPLMVPHWVRGEESSQIVTPVKRGLHLAELGMSIGTPPEGLTAEAVVVSGFERLAKLGSSLKNKIVVFNAPAKRYQQIPKLLEPIDANRINEGGGRTDIEPLAEAGVPTFSPTTTMAHYFDWHHTEAATLVKVNEDDLRRNRAVLAVMAYVLTDMADRLPGSAK